MGKTCHLSWLHHLPYLSWDFWWFWLSLSLYFPQAIRWSVRVRHAHGTICSSACGHNEAMFNGNRKQEKNRPNQLIFSQDDICNILWLYMNAECTVDKYYRIPINNTLKSIILHPFQFALFDCHFQSRSCQRERWWKCRTIRRLQLQEFFGRKPLEQRDEPHNLIHPKFQVP